MQLHIITDSREPSLSLARKVYAESEYDLGKVIHCREIYFADCLTKMFAKCSGKDMILVSMSYISKEQLEKISLPVPPQIMVSSFSCFSHIESWCRNNQVNFIPNPYKNRNAPPLNQKSEALDRVWVQFRLMLAIISKTRDLSEVCRNLILGIPENAGGGHSLKAEHRRAIRYYKLGEPDMAGGTYPGEKQVPNSIDKLRHRINIIAATDFNVLITGESGTGKETTAWAIHELSLRKNKPFLTINCAGLPEELLESELFGYKKGSHNTAHEDYSGILGAVDGGTLFLDELPDMSPRIQAKLLRFLENLRVFKILCQ